MKRKEKFILLCCSSNDQNAAAHNAAAELADKGYTAAVLDRPRKLRKLAKRDGCTMLVLFGRPDGYEKSVALLCGCRRVYLSEKTEDGGQKLSMLVNDNGVLRGYPIPQSTTLAELAGKAADSVQSRTLTISEQKKATEKRQRRVMWTGLLLAALYGIFITVRKFFFNI